MTELQQFLQHIVLGIVDEIVEVANEERSKKKEGGEVIRRLILPLMKSNSIEPVSTSFPSPSSYMLQPQVLKQPDKNDSCGYYALYNIFAITSALTAPTDEIALSYFHHLRQRARFWFFYSRMTKHLYKRASTTTLNYPWTRGHIDTGTLERNYIQYLMEGGFLNGGPEITVLSDFSMTGMRNNKLPIGDLRKLSEVFAGYKKGKEIEGKEDKRDKEEDGEKDNEDGHSRVHAFLVGQACHWISLVCVKFQGKVEVVVLDSRNHNLLTSTYEDFVKILDENCKEKIPDWQRHIYMCSLTEPKMTADLFHDCIIGAKDVIISLLEHNMEGFLNSFEEYVEKSELADVWIVPFIAWLESYWPPPVVEANIIGVLTALGVSNLSLQTRAKFIRMAKTIRAQVGDFSEIDIPVIKRFEVILKWLEQEFSALPEK